MFKRFWRSLNDWAVRQEPLQADGIAGLTGAKPTSKVI